MKQRLLLLTVLLLFALPLHAQWCLGGAFSINHTGRDKSTSLDFRPDVSYSFGRLSVGLSSTINLYSALTDGKKDQTLNFSFTPYLQYTFWSKEPFSFFLEGGLEFARVINDVNTYSHWLPYLTPGVEFSLSEHWALVTYLGRLEYDSHIRRISFNAAFDSITAGLYYYF